MTCARTKTYQDSQCCNFITVAKHAPENFWPIKERLEWPTRPCACAVLVWL